MNRKTIKKLTSILILFVIIFGIISCQIKSYGATYTYTSATNDLPANFDSLYPGYSSLISSLAITHPNWTFKLYETGLSWDAVINNENLGHNSSPKNLVPAGDSRYSGDWICSICGTKAYDNGSWYCASRSAIEYMMDPRNSINENDLFQFQDLASSSADRVAIESMVAGTFINTPECVDALFTAATTYNVSPYHLVSRIIQEQGTSGSTLGLGISENGITYYNLFNIGATGNSSAEVIQNGFDSAKSYGWTSMASAIVGGSEFVAKNYIAKGQSTLYYQKFNVVNANSLYDHQYMQNVLAAQSEGSSMKRKYSDYRILESSFTFNIPLYSGMPASACARPAETSTPLQSGEIAYVNASALTLRDAPNGNPLGYIYNGAQVSILEKGTELVNDHYWYRISSSIGIGYVASEYLATPSAYKIEGSFMYVTPTTTLDAITGATNNTGTFGTGTTINFNGATYTLVMLGDANGDGIIDIIDLALIKRHLIGTKILTDSYKQAMLLQRNNEIDIIDMALLKRHLIGTRKLSL